MLSDKYRPKNQLDCDHANALRDMEAACKIWMNTSIFNPEAARIAKANKDEAIARYFTALEAKRAK